LWRDIIPAAMDIDGYLLHSDPGHHVRRIRAGHKAVRRYARVGLLLSCILVMGCASAEQQRQQHMEAKQRFANVMNQMVGKTPYETILGDWGPPSDRKETATEISGLWGDQLVGAPAVISQRVKYQDWHVRMVFDRRSLLLKSWEEIGSGR
jgi:hypothetical protein